MKSRRVAKVAVVNGERNNHQTDLRRFQPRRIAVAVQLAFAVGAGAGMIAPVHAQQIACPAAGVTVITFTATNATIPCNVTAGTLNINSGGLLTNSGALNVLSTGGILGINAGGVLSNNGILDNSGTLTSAFGGTLTNAAGGTLNNTGLLFNYAGATLTNSGTLNNNNGVLNYAGATLTNSGTLTNNSNMKNFGTLTNAAGGTLTNNHRLYNNDTLTNSGTLTNTGTLYNYGTLTNAAGGTLTNTGTLYNYAGATLTNSGTLTNTGTLRNYAGATLTNSGTLTNTGTLYNYGTLTNAAGGTLTNNNNLYNAGTITNSGTFTITGTGSLYGPGTFTQSAGTLRVDGTLTQSALTINGGTLTGTGTITAPVVNSGILLPGATGVPGTLTIVGSLTQNLAATLVVNVTPTQASRVTITGPASIAGSVQVVAGAGTYPATPYTILSATGGVTGTFSSVSSNSAFLSPALSYNPNTVFLTLTQTAAFSSVALTPNQITLSTLLGNIQSGGGGSTDLQSVLAALSGLPAAEARAAFDSLAAAGRTGAGFKAQLGMAGGFIGTLTTRLGGGGAGSGPLALGGVQLAAGNGVLSDANPVYAQAAGRLAGGGAAGDGGWVLAYGNDGKTTGDANATGYRQNGVGFAFGADTAINAQLRAGAALNIGTQRVRGDAGTGNLDTDGMAVAAYARYADGPLTINVVGGAGRNSNDGARGVNFGGAPRVAASDYHSTQQFAHAEAAYTMFQRTGYSLAPVAALGYTRVANSAYTETGAGALNLVFGEQARESIKSYLGVRTVHALDNGGKGLQLTTRALWSHEFGNADSAVTSAQFAGAPGAFQTSGVNLQRDGAVLGVGVSGELRRNLALFGDVAVETRSKQTNTTLQVGARYTW